MFIQLSTMDVYVWREAFDFLSPTGDRKKVALVSGFGDRRFSDVCQKWLHEWVKNIRIEKLKIKAEHNKTASLRACKWDSQKHSYNKAVVPFAESELPANIQDFETIHIKLSHADPTVLQFLRRMQPLYRFFDLNFCFHNGQMEEAVLVQLLPILIGGGVDTIFMNMTDQPLFTIRRHFPFRFFDIRYIWLQLGDEDNTAGLAELLLHWLGTRREDGEPRMLTLNAKADVITELFNGIQTHFHDATSPVSFFARLFHGIPPHEAVPLTIPPHELITRNAETNEQLVFREYEDNFGKFQQHIGRCPSAVNGQKWLQEIIGKNYGFGYWDRNIFISSSIDETMEESKGGEDKEEVDLSDCKIWELLRMG